MKDSEPCGSVPTGFEVRPTKRDPGSHSKMMIVHIITAAMHEHESGDTLFMSVIRDCHLAQMEIE